MVNKVRWSSVSKFLRRGGKVLCLLVLAAFIYSTTTQARVCFLPGGLCPGDKTPRNTTGTISYEDPKAPQGGDCTGFNLTQIKCKGQACEEGWNCESCTNAQGTFYKCRVHSINVLQSRHLPDILPVWKSVRQLVSVIPHLKHRIALRVTK